MLFLAVERKKSRTFECGSSPWGPFDSKCHSGTKFKNICIIFPRLLLHSKHNFYFYRLNWRRGTFVCWKIFWKDAKLALYPFEFPDLWALNLTWPSLVAVKLSSWSERSSQGLYLHLKSPSAICACSEITCVTATLCSITSSSSWGFVSACVSFPETSLIYVKALKGADRRCQNPQRLRREKQGSRGVLAHFVRGTSDLSVWWIKVNQIWWRFVFIFAFFLAQISTQCWFHDRLPFLKEKTSDELTYTQDVIEFLSHMGTILPALCLITTYILLVT